MSAVLLTLKKTLELETQEVIEAAEHQAEEGNMRDVTSLMQTPREVQAQEDRSDDQEKHPVEHEHQANNVAQAGSRDQAMEQESKESTSVQAEEDREQMDTEGKVQGSQVEAGYEEALQSQQEQGAEKGKETIQEEGNRQNQDSAASATAQTKDPDREGECHQTRFKTRRPIAEQRDREEGGPTPGTGGR